MTLGEFFLPKSFRVNSVLMVASTEVAELFHSHDDAKFVDNVIMHGGFNDAGLLWLIFVNLQLN